LQPDSSDLFCFTKLHALCGNVDPKDRLIRCSDLQAHTVIGFEDLLDQARMPQGFAPSRSITFEIFLVEIAMSLTVCKIKTVERHDYVSRHRNLRANALKLPPFLNDRSGPVEHKIVPFKFADFLFV
jgi:hypothetical protein